LAQPPGCPAEFVRFEQAGRVIGGGEVAREAGDKPTVDVSEIERSLEDFVRRSFDVSADDPRFSRTIDLYTAGYVDSLGVVELLAFIDRQFGVEIPERLLASDDFSSVQGIARIVHELM